MATYQQERDEFIGLMVAEGVSVTTARKLLSAASTLQKLAELECSSERADRDRVLCPGAPYVTGGGDVRKPRGVCICDYNATTDQHGTVPRIARRAQRVEKRVMELAGGKDYTAKTCPGRPCAEGCDHKTLPKFTPIFGGDPRGAVLKVKVPSGKWNSWGGKDDGICVPARGFSAAQMERICR